MSRWSCRRRSRGESGQTTLLLIGFAAVLALMVALVVDASSAYLHRQGLTNLADGAALQGADQGVGGALTGQDGNRLAVDASAARAAVAEYLRTADASGRFPGIVHAVSVDGSGAVSVRLEAPLDLPLHLPGVPRTTTVSGEARAAVTVVP